MNGAETHDARKQQNNAGDDAASSVGSEKHDLAV